MPTLAGASMRALTLSWWRTKNSFFLFPIPANYPDLQGAIDFAIGKLTLSGAVAVEITTSETYPQTGSLDLNINVPSGCTVELRAADGKRPTLLLDDEISITGDSSSTCALNGLLVAASASMAPGSPTPAALVHVPAARPDGSDNKLEALNLTHCTLVPGWSVATDGTPRFPTAPNVVAEPSGLTVTATKSILGAIRAGEFVDVEAFDCIVDATDPTSVAIAALDGIAGVGSLTLGTAATPGEIPSGCTVVGKVHAVLLSLVSNSIVWAAITAGDSWRTGLIADRKQEGCLRFSFLPAGAKTPRRYRMRGADHRRTAAYLLRTALRTSGLHEAVDLYTRCGAPRRRRRRRDGRVSLRAGAATRDRSARTHDGVSAGGSGVRNPLPELRGVSAGTGENCELRHQP